MANAKPGRPEDADAVFENLRARVLGGAYLLLDKLDDAELVAMQRLLESGEAEIVNAACKPFLVAKLERVILPP